MDRRCNRKNRVHVIKCLHPVFFSFFLVLISFHMSTSVFFCFYTEANDGGNQRWQKRKSKYFVVKAESGARSTVEGCGGEEGFSKSERALTVQDATERVSLPAVALFTSTRMISFRSMTTQREKQSHLWFRWMMSRDSSPICSTL